VTAHRTTVAAFAAIVAFGGVNGVAVRYSDRELAPLWGAAIRFGLASALLFGLVVVRRTPLPRGRALTGSLLYGLLGFAGAFGLIYWGLVQTPAGVGQIILALVPLLTYLFAIAQGLERSRWQNLAGALLAMLGIALVFGDRIGAAGPTTSLLAILGAAACMAAANVVLKQFPKCHPVANNAIAMGMGTAILLVLSLIAGEPHGMPTQAQTWAAVGYLALIGSVGVFSLFLYVIARWSASATSYVMLLMPLVTVAVAAALTSEAITTAYLAGGALVLGGVYVGAFAPALRTPIGARPIPPSGDGMAANAKIPEPSSAQREGPGVVTPGCA
jgi:drug/metabolite transporter (DMT)-like permease